MSVCTFYGENVSRKYGAGNSHFGPEVDALIDSNAFQKSGSIEIIMKTCEEEEVINGKKKYVFVINMDMRAVADPPLMREYVVDAMESAIKKTLAFIGSRLNTLNENDFPVVKICLFARELGKQNEITVRSTLEGIKDNELCNFVEYSECVIPNVSNGAQSQLCMIFFVKESYLLKKYIEVMKQKKR